MTKRELKAAIRAKEKEAREQRDKLAASQDLKEVRAINDTLEKIRDDLDELEAQLDELEEQDENGGDNGDGENSRSFDFGAATGTGEMRSDGSRVLGSFGRGSTGTSKPGEALKRNESFNSRLASNERKPLDLGKYVRGAVTGNWDGASEERAAMGTTATGVIIPAVLSGQIIDKARNISLFTSAGVPVYPMESNNLTIARVASDPVFGFKQELAPATESEFSLDSVKLESKTAYGYAYVSLEAIQSASNLSQILTQVFAKALAETIDNGLLYGRGSEHFEPAGIMTDTEINSITAKNTRYNDFLDAIAAVKGYNGNPTHCGINSETDRIINGLCDGNGNVLTVPKAYEDMTKIVSNQLKSDTSKGSDAIVFDPNAIAIGMQKQITFRMITDSDYCIKNGAVGFQIYSMIDCVAVQPKHIAKITGVKNLTA